MVRTMMGRGLRWLALVGATALLASCGGGGGCTNVFGNSCDGNVGGSNPSATSIEIVLSAGTVSNAGNEAVVATVIALNANNNAMPGVPITVSADSGIVTVTRSSTDETGILEASISTGANALPRTITITATSGALTRSASLQVVAGGGSVMPSDMILVLSSATISNSGTGTVKATVTALDARRNVLPGATVELSVDAGATVAPSGPVTDETGVVTGAIGIGGNPVNRPIVVTARSGSLTRTAVLQVSDAPTTTGPVASDLTLALSGSTLNNGGTNTITATVIAVDGNRNVLPGIPVTIKVDASAVAQVSSAVTDVNGTLTAEIGIGSNRSNRVISVTATSGALTRSASFVVIGAKLNAALVNRVKPGATGNVIEYTLVDTNASPMASQAITITRSAGGAPATGATDANGKYRYSYDATGVVDGTTLTFTATAAGATRDDLVEVKLDQTPPNVTKDIKSASITPSPSVIPVNQVGSTDNQVELRALFVDDKNEPIPNVRVRFDLADTPSGNTDGTVDWVGNSGGQPSYSDVAGVARGTFIPKTRSSPTNGVTVRACYDKVDFPAGTCPNAVTNTLTVANEALAVNIRTNELIKQGEAELTYIKEFVVMVVDSAGQAKADVQITPSVDLPAFHKGFYVFNDVARQWVQVRTLAADEGYEWVAGSPGYWKKLAAVPTDLFSGMPKTTCPNDDVNRNGVREATVHTAMPPALTLRGEDLNWNNELDPRKSDVAVKMVGSSRTDGNGLAIVQIEYGKNLASWVDFVITVTATGVSGTEARAKFNGLLWGQGNLPYPGDAVTDPTKAPAFVVSPYGRSTTCQDAD